MAGTSRVRKQFPGAAYVNAEYYGALVWTLLFILSALARGRFVPSGPGVTMAAWHGADFTYIGVGTCLIPFVLQVGGYRRRIERWCFSRLWTWAASFALLAYGYWYEHNQFHHGGYVNPTSFRAAFLGYGGRGDTLDLRVELLGWVCAMVPLLVADYLDQHGRPSLGWL